MANVRSEPREGGKATHDAIDCDSRYVECDVATELVTHDTRSDPAPEGEPR